MVNKGDNIMLCRACGHEHKDMDCMDVLKSFPAEFEKALIEWDKANPIKTFLSDFLEKHPKAVLNEVGTPFICPCDLGYTSNKACVSDKNGDFDCLACWSRPLETRKNLLIERKVV